MRKMWFLMFVFILVLTSCGGTDFNENVVSNLVDGVDYIDHSSTYDGDTLSYKDSMWYVNELNDVPLPDPQIYVENGIYYIVGTSDRDGKVVDCYQTQDFVTYEKHLGIYEPANFDGWEASDASIYAPEMYCFEGVYYLYYSAKDKSGIRRNSVVVSDNPVGPYEPLVNSEVDGLNNPLFLDKNQNNDVLDISVFVDDDNKMYMYYSVADAHGQHIVGVELISPYEADWSTYVKVVEAGALNSSNSILKPLTWEMFRQGLPIVEAPFMIKSKGKYYLTYSVNGCWNKYYNVCYTVSDSPLGVFTKPFTSGEIWTNLLLGYPGTKISDSTIYQQWSGFASGTGHHCFFNVGDEVMIGYHAHQNRDWNNEAKYTRRYFAFDYLHFDKNGVPFVNGPTWSIQPLPEGISGYKNIASKAKINTKNVTNKSFVNDNYIVDCYNLKGEEEKEVVLGSGYSFIELVFDKEYEIAGFAIYNSAYYDKALAEIEYVDFGNGNAVKYPQFCWDMYVNDDKSFIYPNSAITVEFVNSFKAKKVIICVKSENVSQLNEIVVLGK